MASPISEEQFLAELLDRLSLPQKVGQMTMAERLHVTPDDVKHYSLGAVLAGGGSHPGDNRLADWVEMNDGFWQAAVQGEDSLGIPILFALDAVHGHGNLREATIFPHNIGLGAANSPDLVARTARVTAREILASGLDWNFAPTVAVVQNCQWGRTYESFGSDPERVARLAEAYVRALQDEGIMGCAKHWVGDGATLHGIDQGETRLSWDDLECAHVAPYYPSLKADVMSVMVSFNSWNGEKCHGHRFLVNDLLKEQLRFEGIVVSDWNGIDYLDEDFDTAVVRAVNAGLDLFMVPERWRKFIATLIVQVREGRVAMNRIDDAVTRILRGKYRLGLFERPRPEARPLSNQAIVGCDAHRAVAREAVRRSLVLLNNERELLPLDSHQRILVAGRNAHNLGHQCGGWTLSWQGEDGNETIKGTSIWQAISQAAPNAELSGDLTGAEADPDQHEAAVVVIGERPYAEGFGDIRSGDEVLVETGSMIQGLMNPLAPYGSTLALNELHPEDLACIRRIRDAGVPVIAILISGRPLIVNDEIEAAQAFIAAWLPGSEGAGVADILFGNEDFTGRLPLPWPSHMLGDDAKSTYETRFPVGFGLSMGRLNEANSPREG